MTLPIIRPTLPSWADLEALLANPWETGMVTVGPLVRALEAEACRVTGARHAVALSSCTAGLMLVPRALDLPPGSEVIVPSFTFAATAQALLWNGLVPVFCDCLPDTGTLDPADVEANLSTRTSAICPVTIYGLPPDVDALVAIARRARVPIYFDSAQGMGATYKGRPLGCEGACEVFSMSPTKVVTAVEGGLVTTDNDDLAGRLRAMRDYGKDPVGGEEMLYLGLSARMSELHAAVGLASLRKLPELVKARQELIALYRERLGTLPGCRVQAFPPDRHTGGNYFVLFISSEAKRSRDEVYAGLREVGIQTKRYFYPPLYAQRVFADRPHRVSRTQTNTQRLSAEGLAMPLYSHMTLEQLDQVCEAVRRLLA